MLQNGWRRSKGEDEIIKTSRTSVPDDVVPTRDKHAARDDDDDDTGDEDGNDPQNEEYDDSSNEDEGDSHNTDPEELITEDGEIVGTEKKRLSRQVTHGFHLVEGKMGHFMEDYLVAKKRKMHGNDLGLYAIFDGHSGRDVAEYLKNNLFDNILHEPDFWTSPVSAVKKAYRHTDEHILENVVGHRGGSTAVTAILINGIKLFVANVGDSRALLCKNGKAKQITVDHEPEKERGLVERKGGFISRKRGNIPRVDGQLAMTRAFGDGKLKDHITAEPDVSIEDLDKDTEFIILASDGLWKVMSNQEASDCIRGLDDGKEAARELIKEALARGSPDDISCIVVVLE